VPVRSRLQASGLTLDDLVVRAGYSKSRISELLSGSGHYPRWEITYSVIQVLGLPPGPVLRLWKAAAREAAKKEAWISGCVRGRHLTEPGQPPVDFEGFAHTVRAPYAEFAEALLATRERAEWVLSLALDRLWLAWKDALASENTSRYAWDLFRGCVMARAPRLKDAAPDLRAAAFRIVEQHPQDPMPCLPAVFESVYARIERRAVLFEAIGRLPHNQLDITVLVDLCGIDEGTAADVLGVTPALARTFRMHARTTLKTDLSAVLHTLGE
jgi:transcriptional regulator with XRE-family HTH domain